MKVREEETVGDGKKKQEVEVVDGSDVGNVVWYQVLLNYEISCKGIRREHDANSYIAGKEI